MDRRIRKTETALFRAFSELITIKGLEKISVKELCEKADINKSTFYLRYNNIFDFADSVRKTLGEKLTHSLEGLSLQQVVGSLPDVMSSIMNVINENRELYLPIFQSPHLSGFAKKIVEEEIKRVLAMVDEDTENYKDYHLASVFIVSGIFGMLEHLEPENLDEQSVSFLGEKIKKGFYDCLK